MTKCAGGDHSDNGDDHGDDYGGDDGDDDGYDDGDDDGGQFSFSTSDEVDSNPPSHTEGRG